MNYIEILNNGKNFLKKNKIKNPILDSELLLSKVLNKSREEILLNSNYILKKQEINKFNSYLLRRKYNEPIAYILGFKYFWKYIICNFLLRLHYFNKKIKRYTSNINIHICSYPNFYDL